MALTMTWVRVNGQALLISILIISKLDLKGLPDSKKGYLYPEQSLNYV